MERKYGLRCPNVFHAGDGNLHPLILFDANDPDELARTERSRARCWRSASRWAARSPASTASASRRSTRCACSSPADELERFRGVKRAFDPAGLLNPGQEHPDAAPLRRVRPDARARRRAAASGSAAVLALPARRAAARSPRRSVPRRRRGSCLRLRGGGTKDFYGQALAGEILDTRGVRRHRRVRPDRARDHGARRHAARRDRGGARGEAADARVRAAAFRQRIGRDDRRRRRRRPVGAAARGRGRAARLRARRAGDGRPRRGPRIRRPA